jgi:hypothetical protein
MISLLQTLDAFQKKLDPIEAPADTIIPRLKIRDHFVSVWQPVRDAVIGSYKRGTNLRPTREIDYMFVLGPKYQPYLTNDPARVLDDVNARIGMVFPRSRPRVSPRGLLVSFHDASVVLVPAFVRHGSGLFLPDTDMRRWIPSDPDAHALLLSEVQRKFCPQAHLVIRALKCWKRTHSVAINGYHLELLALRALSVTPTDFLSGILAALDGIATGVTVRCPPQGSAGDDADMYLALDPAKRNTIAQVAKRAAETLRESVACGDSASQQACLLAQTVFGELFPVAGT